MRALVDPNGEVFGYLDGSRLYTLDDELTGEIDGNVIVDLAGSPIWRLQGDGVYTLDGSRAVGYFSQEQPPDLE